MTEKELLAILDLPEREQWRWLCDQHLFESFNIHLAGTVENKTFLADLAFRLRDEVIDKNGVYAWREAKQEMGTFGNEKTTEKWWQEYAQPIHWIIAALIAKEKEK